MTMTRKNDKLLQRVNGGLRSFFLKIFVRETYIQQQTTNGYSNTDDGYAQDFIHVITIKLAYIHISVCQILCMSKIMKIDSISSKDNKQTRTHIYNIIKYL